MNTPSLSRVNQFARRLHWRKLVLVPLVLALAGWSAHEVHIHFPSRSHGMNEYTQSLKTICVGRYLWDVPQQAAIGNIAPIINDIEIERMPGDVKSDDGMQWRLEQYEQTLRKELAPLEYNSGIKEVKPFGTKGKLFLYRREDPTNGLLNAVAYTLVGSAVYKLKQKEFSTENTQLYLDQFANLAKAMRPRAQDESPRQPGLCIDGAFVSGSAFEWEMVTIDFKLPDYPGFRMSFSSQIGREPADSEKMNSRVTRNWSAMGLTQLANVKRKTSLSLLGQPGQELMYTSEDKGAHYFNASAEIWGDGTIAKQHLEFNADNATHKDTDEHTPYPKVLPDDTAIAIWDTVLKTLRLRPGAI